MVKKIVVINEHPLKVKHKGRAFKNWSAKDKDELIFELGKKFNLIDKDALFD